jgi:hypothetical protein
MIGELVWESYLKEELGKGLEPSRAKSPREF